MPLTVQRSTLLCAGSQAPRSGLGGVPAVLDLGPSQEIDTWARVSPPPHHLTPPVSSAVLGLSWSSLHMIIHSCHSLSQ